LALKRKSRGKIQRPKGGEGGRVRPLEGNCSLKAHAMKSVPQDQRGPNNPSADEATGEPSRKELWMLTNCFGQNRKGGGEEKIRV